ncbi:hypothetical protein SORBI_3001G074500 [Sorghum bicolor]|uniref:Uncharacterized protein n=1 Tax=Sorghum bicolor TaxID=4558 RepID=A0A1Z5S526_SORBI|nr:hypothetical protein SORBI_3001G074500 [Sorghum bicolor]
MAIHHATYLTRCLDGLTDTRHVKPTLLLSSSGPPAFGDPVTRLIRFAAVMVSHTPFLGADLPSSLSPSPCLMCLRRVVYASSVVLASRSACIHGVLLVFVLSQTDRAHRASKGLEHQLVKAVARNAGSGSSGGPQFHSPHFSSALLR